MGSTHTITVRNNRPYIVEGERYLIFDGSEAANPGDYHIEVAVEGQSDVRVEEQYLRIFDLTTVAVLGSYQVAH